MHMLTDMLAVQLTQWQHCIQEEEVMPQSADWSASMSVNMCMLLSTPHSCWGNSSSAECFTQDPVFGSSMLSVGSHKMFSILEILPQLSPVFTSKSKICKKLERNEIVDHDELKSQLGQALT